MLQNSGVKTSTVIIGMQQHANAHQLADDEIISLSLPTSTTSSSVNFPGIKYQSVTCIYEKCHLPQSCIVHDLRSGLDCIFFCCGTINESLSAPINCTVPFCFLSSQKCYLAKILYCIYIIVDYIMNSVCSGTISQFKC